MAKIDYKKQLKHLYGPRASQVDLVEVPRMSFLMVDGAGDPNTSRSFAEAIEALYPVSYTLKFMIKKGEIAIDYGVMPLEALWWAEDMSAFASGNKEAWQWTLMVMQPECVTPDLVEAAIAEVAKMKKPLALPLVRFEAFTEGLVAQTLHIGPFSAEGPTIERVHDFIAEQGRNRSGKHHEIYLSDLRRAAPEKWKTIVRQPCS
jgi:hypothetical protein